ncbi:MAG: hypothetical protein L3J96_02855, partial [Thermoplasmata archaeon]|nr:hypothetical protein [Thermoplasmata archaeon]
MAPSRSAGPRAGRSARFPSIERALRTCPTTEARWWLRGTAGATQGGFPNALDAVGYYTAKQIPQYFAYARSYVLGDRFFVGQMGPTLPNRIFDLAGTDANWTTDLLPPPTVLNVPTVLDQLSAAC